MSIAKRAMIWFNIDAVGREIIVLGRKRLLPGQGKREGANCTLCISRINLIREKSTIYAPTVVR
ncbi:MAG: hypothetical protein GX376_04375 [Firmicutes bacterium]|nr:hypothetical protein [Bacillota bacterium]